MGLSPKDVSTGVSYPSSTCGGVAGRTKTSRHLLQRCVLELQAEGSSIFLADSANATLQLVESIGPRENRHCGKIIRFNEGITGQVANRKQPLFVTDPAEMGLSRRSEYSRDSFISYPVLRGASVLAVINVAGRKGKRSFSASDLKKLGPLCEEFADSLTAAAFHTPTPGPRGSIANDIWTSQESPASVARHFRGVMHENADIFRNLSETAIIFDHDLRIAACSNERAFASLFGQGQGVPALGASVLDLPVNIDLRELREEIEKLFMEDVPFARKSVGLKNAGEPRSLNLSFFPFTSRPWRGTNGVLLIEDATEHYRMFERLAEAEKFSALGSLTSMITHEINNPLDGVLRLVKLSLTRLESDSPAHTYLTEALKGLNRTLSLIRSILTFSRSGSPLGTRTSPLNAVIEAATEEVRRKYSDKEISVDLDLAPKNLSVSTDDFYMVISNLVSNAFDAIGSKSGSIRIETNVKDDRLYILVEDSGCGISDHVRPHIFSAFFTTKDYGEGAGLGLSIVKKIIDKYNGTVDVQSEMNLGTHMHITFPLNKLTS